MGKSRAEICRDYRKRLKERDNEGYLRKERERRRKSYVPSAILSRSANETRRLKNRDAVRRFRERQRRLREEHGTESMDTSGYESISAQPEQSENLVVRMSFPSRSEGPRKRIASELKWARSKLEKLKKENNELARKLKTEQRRRQRVLKRLTNFPRTPKSRSEALMSEAGLTKLQKDKVRREIIFGNVIAEQLSTKKSEHNKGSIGGLHMIIAGQILRKYKCSSTLCNKVGLNKTTLSRYTNIRTSGTKKDGSAMTRKNEKMIIAFLERDDNSRAQPGKADKVKGEDGEDKQARVLTDYLQNLHRKFQSENPAIEVSFATFCRIRPKHIQLSAFISRSSCLCTKHQNMAMTTKALRGEGICVSVNPEVFIRNDLDKETVHHIVSDCVNVQQWKRVEIEDRGKRKYVMRVQNVKMAKSEFINHVFTQREEFAQHVKNMKTQYEQIRHLKHNLHDKQVVIHMDFAENFACRNSEEIQSAYFNQTSVTLHPVVLYYKQNDDLKHKSIVIVSDTLSHNANTVVTFLDTIISEVKQIVPDISVCHYWTDSPTSQYRNKLIFDTVAHHSTLYGCSAVWNYFEAGHGKGPCDGLGGTVKRMADIAIKTGKATIQDAFDFFTWATEKSSFANVAFKFVSDATIADKIITLADSSSKLQPVKGTMKLHAVASTDSSTIMVRETSCYCNLCLSGKYCNTWRAETTRKVPTTVVYSDSNKSQNPVVSNMKIRTNDFVAAVYESSWYVGQVIEMDDNDGEVEITFMEKRKHLFQWPRKLDKIWVSQKDIMCVIDTPTATGKSSRMFKLSETDHAKIMSCFSARK